MKSNRKLHILWMAVSDERLPRACSQNRRLVTQGRGWYKFIAVRDQLNWQSIPMVETVDSPAQK
jgi:hypothetical protein